MDQLSYTDYYYADRYVLFTGTGVDDIAPFEQMIGEAQLNYQRIELRWNGEDQVQQFSVTKDGIAVLETIHTVGKAVERWAQSLLAELLDEQMDQIPSYRVCVRACNGPGLDGEIGEDEVFWDGHEQFSFSTYNDPIELHHEQPEVFQLPTDDRGAPEILVGYDHVAEISGSDIEILYNEFGSDLGTVLDEQSRSRFVDSMDHFIRRLLAELSLADITHTNSELEAMEKDRKYQAAVELKRQELSFIYKARNRFLIVLIISPLIWIYVRSAAVSFGYAEPHYGYAFLAGGVMWFLWQLGLTLRSFSKGGVALKNLRALRKYLNAR